METHAHTCTYTHTSACKHADTHAPVYAYTCKCTAFWFSLACGFLWYFLSVDNFPHVYANLDIILNN